MEPAMTRADIDQLLARHHQAFASRSAAALTAGHTESGSFFSPAAGTVTGHTEIRKVYEYWLTAFPDMEFTWGPPIIDGQRVALFWHFGGTLAGKFFGDVRPGTRVQFDGAAEYLVSPEGIVSARHLFDFTGALVAAGVLKVKPT
jgi:predicted ester cyclase